MIKLETLHPNEGQINGVPSNPRYITEEEFNDLKRSILEFPKMMAIDPIVVDENGDILAGNQRYEALRALADDEAVAHLVDKDGADAGYYKFTDDIPEEWCKRESNLTAEEKMEFVIKDNMHMGEWAKGMRKDWGALVDNLHIPVPTEEQERKFEESKHTAPAEGGEDEEPNFDLPEELQDQDLNPDDLPDYEGDDETEYEYVVITYEEGEEQLVAETLGIDKIEKIVYEYNDIKKGE